MPATSPSEEANERHDPEFKWGKKRGVGGPKKDIRFYESFTYDGIDYTLYDCVYLYKEGEPEPYIGKLVKIWEQPKHKRKIKVHWFFRPIEILNWLGGDIALEKEVFLASGEGVGLANINPLEVLVGKCNVICTSKDERNPQPSEEDIKTADYIFFRTFDVGNCTISDYIRDKFGGIEVEHIFNRKDVIKSVTTTNLETSRSDENKNVVVSNGMSLSSSALDSTVSHNVVGRAENPGLETDVGSNLTVGTRIKHEERLSNEKTTKALDIDANEIKPNVSGYETSNQEGITDNSSAHDKEKNEKSMRKSTVGREENAKASELLVEYKSKVRPCEESSILDVRSPKKARISDNSSNPFKEPESSISHPSALDKDKPNNKLQKLKVVSDHPSALNKDKPNNKLQKLKVVSDQPSALDKYCDEGHGKELEASLSNSEKSKGQFVKDSTGHDKGPSNKKNDEKKAKPSENTLHKAAPSVALKDNKTDGLVVEVSRRPDADRSKWFKGLPWEQRLKTAHEQGTLVLLENLDPSYSSSEIEDIIWHGFKENCTAKVIQRTIFLSPHCGRAFVIFKSREAAEMAVKKLDQGCLMLPNGRPLVGSKGRPVFPGKPSKFAGHLIIDKVKLQMQREEMKNAVSTSHCSQPNTIEYEMAMEWRLLQEKSDIWWKELYKQQGEGLRKLRNSLKTK
ncbi:hypothetical protein AAC387_Pa05g1518 [Persea americana]